MTNKYIGSRKKINDISNTYLVYSNDDEIAGDILAKQGKYKHACYFYVQSMEKYVRYLIFQKINAQNDWFNNKTRTHNLDELIDFLIEIVSANKNVQLQIKAQLNQFVLNGVRFGQLHNELRYPNYYQKTKEYTSLVVSKNDMTLCKEKLTKLRIFLKEIEKLK